MKTRFTGGVCAYVSLHECGCSSARAMCCVAFLTLIPFHFILFSTHCFSFLRLSVRLGEDFLFLLDCARALEI